MCKTFLLLISISCVLSCSKKHSTFHERSDVQILEFYMRGQYDSILKTNERPSSVLCASIYSAILAEQGKGKLSWKNIPNIDKVEFYHFYSQILHKPGFGITEIPKSISIENAWAIYKYGFYLKDSIFASSDYLSKLYQKDSTNALVVVEYFKFQPDNNSSSSYGLSEIGKINKKFPYWLEAWDVKASLLQSPELHDYDSAMNIRTYLLKANYLPEFQRKEIEILKVINEHPDSAAYYAPLSMQLKRRQYMPLILRPK